MHFSLLGLGKCRESLSLWKTSGLRRSTDFSVVDGEVEEDLDELSNRHTPVEPVECWVCGESFLTGEDWTDGSENVGVNQETGGDLSGKSLNDERGVEVEDLSEQVQDGTHVAKSNQKIIIKIWTRSDKNEVFSGDF